MTARATIAQPAVHSPEPPFVQSSVTTIYAPHLPVHLSSVMSPLGRGRADPTFRVTTDGAVWRTIRSPAGAATIRLTQRAGGEVHAQAWGDAAEWAIAGVPELLGDGDDWTGLDVRHVPLLHETRRRHPGLRLTRCRQVFEMMAAAIIEQKVTSLEARRSWVWLVSRHGGAAPGPAPAGMKVAPTPAQWLRIPSWDWHRAGVDPKRSRAVLEAARVASGLERTLTLGRSGAEIERRLRTVPGVGVWTAAETSQRAHGDPDAPSVGDYHLPALVGVALIGRPVDDDGMLELLEPWRGHRQHVMRLICASGVRTPRRGPRITIQDHRQH